MSGYGIGAGGLLGFAYEQLPAPVQAAATSSTAGGTLPATSTYKYLVTAINLQGETTVSNEQTVTTGAGATNSNTVNWATVTGATGYKIYRTAAAGASLSELLIATVGAVTTFIDTGGTAPAGAFPLVNSAGTPGVYASPVKYMPFTGESLKFTQNTQWRRPIRQSADVIGAVSGDANVEGDVTMEALEDVIAWWLGVTRVSVVQSGSSPNFIYTATPTAAAIPPKTCSLTVVRAGEVFGYVGCVVNVTKFSIDNGMLMYTVTIIGRDEATQTVPVATWPTSVPFGAGSYSVEFPSGTPVFDTDTIELDIDDGGSAQFRMKNTGRGAQFIQYGERQVQLKASRDFLSRADYDAFKAYTAQSVTITAARGANNSVSLLVPVAIKDTYEVNLSAQGDLVRGDIAYQGVIDGTGKAYQLVVKTQEVVV